jgi:hypothetical protein
MQAGRQPQRVKVMRVREQLASLIACSAFTDSQHAAPRRPAAWPPHGLSLFVTSAGTHTVPLLLKLGQVQSYVGDSPANEVLPLLLVGGSLAASLRFGTCKRGRTPVQAQGKP